MAKRRTNRAVARAKFKAEKASSIRAPGEKSKYARKKKGERVASIEPGRRPSWFILWGWAAAMEHAIRGQAEYEAGRRYRSQMQEAA